MEELPKTGLGEKGQLVVTLVALLAVGFAASLLFASAAEGSYGMIAAVAVAAVAIAFTVLSASRTLDRFQRRLERSASYDQLTGALNCMAFSVLCDHAVKEARRNGTALSVAMFDIDDFAKVVESEGKPGADKALKLVAAGGQSGLRQCDPLCRWGGDEFAALLESCDSAGAVVAADKFRSSAVELCAAEGGVSLTLSAGVATLRPDESFYALIGRADEALVAAKRSGRDRVVAV
jgi:diguanylate cyclase (GGDEF)-like protein